MKIIPELKINLNYPVKSFSAQKTNPNCRNQQTDSFEPASNKGSINKQNNTGFKGGLTPELINAIQSTNVRRVSDHFMGNLGVTVDFQNNRLVAACSALTSNMFMRLGLPLPRGIYVRDFTRFMPKNDANQCPGFCLTVNSKYENRGYPLRSVFFNNKMLTNLNELENMMNFNKSVGHWSSNYFLGHFMHEFFHNVHIDHLYKKYGIDFPDPRYSLNRNPTNTGAAIMRELQAINIERKLPALFTFLSKDVSGYGASIFPETIAEDLVKITTQPGILDSHAMPKYNPFVYGQFTNGMTLQKIIDSAWEGHLGRQVA